MILESQIIFLDTSIFFSENFVEGRKLDQFLKITLDEGLQVKIVDITYAECLKRIESSITKTRSIFKQVNASLNSDGRILRNLVDYQEFYRIPKKIIIEDEVAKMVEIFDEFLKVKKIEVIDSALADHKVIFDKYFKKEPPFGTGQKKDEFPDAFVLNTIEKYAIKLKTSVFLISADKDMLTYQSPYITLVDDLPAMLDYFVRAREMYNDLYHYMNNNISGYSNEIKDALSGKEDEISLLLYEDLLYDHNYEEVEYEPGEIKTVEVNTHYIMSLDGTETEAEIELAVTIKIPLYYNDLSMAYYDKEDGRYWGVVNITENSIYKLVISSRVNFEYEYEEDSPVNILETKLSDFNLVSWEKLEENIDEKSEFSDW